MSENNSPDTPKFRRLESLALLNLQQHTDEQLENINTLLTEVSLDLLGNQFFDIFGQRQHTLEEVCRPDSAKKDGYNADTVDFMAYVLGPPTLEATQSSTGDVGSSKRSSTQADHNLNELNVAKQVPGPRRIGQRRRDSMAEMNTGQNKISKKMERKTQVFNRWVEKELAEMLAAGELHKVEFFYKHSRVNQDKTALSILDEFYDEDLKLLNADSQTLEILSKMIMADKSNAKLREMKEIRILEEALYS